MKKINGRYEITGKLGAGGMGVVYRAYDPPPMDREVAVKTLPALPDRLALDLFYKECSVLKSISHPNIVELFDMGEFDDGGHKKPFFVMPLLPGQPLDELIRDVSHRLTVERVIEIIVQTCRGLHAAHERGLVHRDLKPSNIFVMADDSVKIIDFGVARTMDVLTRTTGLTKGTLLYMAPEQVQHKPVTAQSDIFSLGVVCYEALTRRQPFRAATEDSVVRAILTSIPPAVSEINPAVSQTISRAVHKAMAKQPWNRYDSTREFGETLQKALRNEPIELFDPAKFQPRIERAAKALDSGDHQFAAEIVSELEAAGHIDPQLTLLRTQIDQVVRQKTIAQFLESARARYEEEEDPLALQKIQEILQLDPSNVAALGLKGKIDERRSERQIEKWLRLANQHIDNHSYSHAREALQNVLDLRPKEPRAARLLKDVEAEEEEYLRLRREKAEKYQAALDAWKNGEVSVALSQMKLVLELDRRAPDSSSPETGATYQVFYNRIRSEHDAINAAYADARRCLAERDFPKALQLCRDYLTKYPGQALFQALKFDVEEQQRQQLSAFIADVDRRLEAEPDLDSKVSLLREAIALYPEEAHFKRSLTLMEEKRDLVNSIVARSRVREERGQISEALGDLDILQTIYSPYPGLKFEQERLQKRLEQQARHAARAAWATQIDRQLESGKYVRALELLDDAEREFPGDDEFDALRKLAGQGLERARRAQELFTEGQALCAQGNFDGGIDTLATALHLDDRPTIRTTFRDLLLHRAQAELETDFRAAEALADRVLEFDPNHPIARSIRAQALDRKREEAVSHCASQARRLQAAGDIAGALAEIEQCLAVYPAEPRLLALVETLGKDVGVRRTRAEQDHSRARHSGAEPRVDIEQSQAPFIPPQSIPQEIDRTVLIPRRAAEQPVGDVAVLPPPPPRERAQRKSPRIDRDAPIRVLKTRRVAWAAAVVLGSIAIIGAAVLVRVKPGPSGAPTAVAVAPVDIQTSPAGATITVDNQVRGASNLRLDLEVGEHRLEASLDGYETATATVLVQEGAPAEVRFDLKPLMNTLRITAPDLTSGTVVLDETPVGTVEVGGLMLADISGGQHVLNIAPPAAGSQQGAQQTSIAFEMAPGQLPNVTSINVPDAGAVIVGTRRGRARVQSSLVGAEVTVDGQPAGTLTAAGLEVADLPDGLHELTVGSANQLRTMSFTTGASPAIDVIVFSDRNVGSLLVQTGEDGAAVFIDGREYPTRIQDGLLRIPDLSTTKHTVRVTKDGFKPSDVQSVSILKGQEAVVKFTMARVEKLAALVLQQALPGAHVSIDDVTVGTVGADGTLSYQRVGPGQHIVELALAGYDSKRIPREFTAGETVVLAGADVDLERTPGTLEIEADATTEVVISRGTQVIRRFTGSSKTPLPEGSYTVVAQGPARVPTSATVAIAAGDTRSLDMRNVATGMELFENSGAWVRDNTWLTRRGGEFVLYNKTRSAGKFTFTFRLPRGRFSNPRTRWVVGFVDPQNYVLIQIDEKHFYRSEVIDGKGEPFVRVEHQIPGNSSFVHVAIELTGNRVVHNLSVDGKEWRVLDNWNRTSLGAPRATLVDGRFGFYLPGDDEIRVSNFYFYPVAR